MDPAPSQVWSDVQLSYAAWLQDGCEFKCEFCQAWFQLEDFLFQHLASVHGVTKDGYVTENPVYAFKNEAFCQICGEDEPVQSLLEHVPAYHPGLKPEVYFMRYVFYDASESQSWSDEHAQYTGDFGLDDEGVEGAEGAGGGEKKRRRRRKKRKIKEEEGEIVVGDNQAQCPWCLDVFDNAELADHLKTHSNSKEEKKEEVDDLLGDLIKAEVIKKEEDGFEENNDVIFDDVDEEEDEGDVGSDVVCHCPICFKQFKKVINLKRHKEKFHAEDDDGKREEEKKKFQCQVCSKTFSQASHLNRHVFQHTGQKPFQCEFCVKVFGHKSDLKNHRRIHTGEKPFGCPDCDETFKFRTQLVRHSHEHAGRKPFMCEICTKSFSLKYALDRHMRVHTGEKQWGCEVCGKTFAYKATLVRHKKVVHKVFPDPQ